MIAVSAPRERAVMRRVNELVSELLAPRASGERVPFFCECADPGCYSPVWLSRAEFEYARRLRSWIALADAHVTS